MLYKAICQYIRNKRFLSSYCVAVCSSWIYLILFNKGFNQKKNCFIHTFI
uniref:Uncharacterized protein n=1 Tax=Lepeophtheirus salmonis TaxID=72036 RepID=A0A0K2T7C4_LEPSM